MSISLIQIFILNVRWISSSSTPSSISSLDSFPFASWTCFLWKPSDRAKRYWYPHLREKTRVEVMAQGRVSDLEPVRSEFSGEVLQSALVIHATVGYVLISGLVIEITGKEASLVWVRTQVKWRRRGQWQWGGDCFHTKKLQISKYVKINGIQTSQYWAMKLKIQKVKENEREGERKT